MVAAVRVHKTGGPEVLTYEEVEVPAPGPGQVKVRNRAIGVNFIDTYFRMGMYPSPVGLPFVSGNEGAGDVTAVGPGVTDIKVGDRVGYVAGLGAYAVERLLPADRAVKLPDNISYEQAAAMMLKGMTVQYLVRRTHRAEGRTCSSTRRHGSDDRRQWAIHLGANGRHRRRKRASLPRRTALTTSSLSWEISSPRSKRMGGALCAVVYDVSARQRSCLLDVTGRRRSRAASLGQIDLQHQHPQTKARLPPPDAQHMGWREDPLKTADDCSRWCRARPRSRSTEIIRRRRRQAHRDGERATTG